MVERLLPKQDVVGSNPITRSPRLTQRLASPPPASVTRQLARYRLDACARGYSESTISHTERCVRFFTTFLGGIDDVARVGADDLRRFIISLKDKTFWNKDCRNDRKLSPTTTNTYVRAIRSFWSWLEESRAISANPLAGVPAPRFPRRVARVYTEEQLRAVLKCVAGKPRERAIIELFLDSGIRLSELAGLTVGDVDMALGTVRVLGKGGKERYSYFSPATALSLHDYLQRRPPPRSDNYLFLTSAGDRLTRTGIQSVLDRVGKTAALPLRLAPHKLRHTYATLCLRNGNNLEYVRITLGHTNIKTTSDAYLAASQLDVAQAHRKFSPLANLNRRQKI